MKVIQQAFEVKFNFGVFFTDKLFSKENPSLGDFLKNFGNSEYKKKILFVIDKGAAYDGLDIEIKNYFAEHTQIELITDTLILPGGEILKNDGKYFDQVMNAINDYGIDRHSFVAAIGGGAMLDMVGYAAAVAHRGVKLIRIPTTVLSQNDSGVGVKNGINYYGKKNFLGAFVPPVAVFNDAHFLQTLSQRDKISGISEAVKVSLIKDLAFFEWLEKNVEKLAAFDNEATSYQIFRCAELHMEHIRSGDPFELGSARPLDFGHWAAHKLEYLTNFELRHGEAVAIGLALDVTYSQAIGLLTENERDRVLKVLSGLGFKLFHEALAENNKINLYEGLNEFREHLGGKLTITLLEKLGRGLEVHEMNFEKIKESVDFLEQNFK